MVQITQTEDDIKICIELNRLITRKPDIIVLPTYLKFNTPPIFFERHLAQEIDETASFCRIYKHEARIVLVKKHKGIWPEMFLKLSKEELMQRRLEISNQIVERNKERDQKALERYETKRRTEIEKEIKRETAMRERVKQFQENACREVLQVSPKPQVELKTTGSETARNSYSGSNNCRVSTPVARAMAAMRAGGKINMNFTAFPFSTPKRESQEGLPRPFHKDPKNQQVPEEPKNSLDTLDE